MVTGSPRHTDEHGFKVWHLWGSKGSSDYLTPKTWNSFSLEIIRISRTLETFKCRLETHLFG